MNLEKLEEFVGTKSFNGYRKEILVTNTVKVIPRGLYATKEGKAYIVLSIKGSAHICLKVGSLLVKKEVRDSDIGGKVVKKEYVQFLDSEVRMCNEMIESIILYAFSSNYDKDFICYFSDKPKFIHKFDYTIKGSAKVILGHWVDIYENGVSKGIHRSVGYKEYLPYIRGAVYKYEGKEYIYLGLQYCEGGERNKGVDNHLFLEDESKIKDINSYIRQKSKEGDSCFKFDLDFSETELTSKYYSGINLDNHSLFSFR